jgi:hypothetical protein
MWSISTNILMVLANFLGIHNSIVLKNIGRDCGTTSSSFGSIFVQVVAAAAANGGCADKKTHQLCMVGAISCCCKE